MAKSSHLGRQSLHYAKQRGSAKQRRQQRGKAAVSAARYYTFRPGETRGERLWITPHGSEADYDQVKGDISATARDSKHVFYGYLNPHPALDMSAAEARELLLDNLSYPEGHSREGDPLMHDIYLIRHERNESGQLNPHWHFVAFGDRVPDRASLRRMRQGFTALQALKARLFGIDLHRWHDDHPEYDAGWTVEARVASVVASQDVAHGLASDPSLHQHGLGLHLGDRER